MKVLEAIRNRRSVRRFEDRRVEESKLEAVLEAGRWAPSGLNNQPWRFVVVGDPKVKEKLACETMYCEVIRSAPVCVAVFLDTGESYDREKDTQAIGACVQNMLLSAHAQGLGACWLGEILKKRENVRKILEVPEGLDLMAVVAVGYSSGKRDEEERRELSKLVVKRYKEGR